MPAPLDLLNHRVDALVARFTAIARTRMAGVPVLHAGLHVEAVGFEVRTPDDTPAQVPAASDAVGILITPWFMNLVRLPLQRESAITAVGQVQPLALGAQRFEFIAAHDDALGAYAACSLFSPMFEFIDQAAARATAQAVLDELRRSPAAPPVQARPADLPPARRAFLLGRSAASGAAR